VRKGYGTLYPPSPEPGYTADGVLAYIGLCESRQFLVIRRPSDSRTETSYGVLLADSEAACILMEMSPTRVVGIFSKDTLFDCAEALRT